MTISLDRFAYGLADPADAPERYYGECAYCMEEFHRGDAVLLFDDAEFCAGKTGYEHVARWLVKTGKARVIDTSDVQFAGRMRCEVCDSPEHEVITIARHTFCCTECLAEWLEENGDVYLEYVQEAKEEW